MAAAAWKVGLLRTLGYVDAATSGAVMNAKLMRLALCLLIAGAPGVVQAKTAKSATKAHNAARQKPAAKSTHAASPDAYTTLPEAQRLAIQGNLVWLGHFDGMSAEEFDGHTVEAIKSFQRRNNGAETGVLNDEQRSALAGAVKDRQAAVGWRLTDDDATGARLGVPEKLVPRASTGRVGSRWTSAHGQIEIETFRLHEASLPVLFEQEKKTARRQIASSALNPDSFVIIGDQRLKKFVERVQSNGSEVRGVTVLYDQATEGTMAPVAVAIADTFTGFPDPAMPPGHRRGIDYGTAIIVSTNGELVAVDDAVDDCQSIMVPGFGHAVTIATDKTSDLALLRLYGARNLTLAPLAGDPAGTDLTLTGIASPLAQSGETGATSAAAQLTAQGLTPPPKLGFSGAAARDAQGKFAGIVALKAPVVAGTGAAVPQAALIPAATVRAFLAAQGVAIAGGSAAINQSVVRLICVRK
jgi:Putative peptidoglycan binding domain